MNLQANFHKHWEIAFIRNSPGFVNRARGVGIKVGQMIVVMTLVAALVDTVLRDSL